MDPLAEARAVALLLQYSDGFVHVYCDGSANWSATAPVPERWAFGDDVPEFVAVRRFSYQQARSEYRNAIKRLRARGVYEA